ncbi:hypothetical protein O1Q96_36440 [Streptomyces sp. Qhu-G9]|uniref:TolB family protein n=1 Tax=Streptomyces sp. Qhu-G9 TaxID=3452799 RepID=UPI0022AC861A|nr:hypothetical protein [Streptomyces aurantiacus]WAU84700.1 hypothetical protein O1Q96_36440 [Streptomyces aurantiacus]
MTTAQRAALGAALIIGLTGVALPASAAPQPAPRTEKASVAPDGADGDGWSTARGLSADGRYLAFVSQADNLVADDTNGESDAFVRDLRTGVTRRVNTTAGGGQSDARVFDLSLSADGRYAAFGSDATDLVPGDTGGRSHVYVKDLRTGAIERIEDGFAPGYDTAGAPVISADGRYVALVASRSELSPEADGDGRVYRVDRRTDTAVRVSEVPDADRRRSVTNLSISADGNRVGYQFFVPFPSRGDWSDIHVRDVPSGKLWQVDKAPDGAVSDGQSEYSSLSADGRYALFRSLDSQLTPGDTNGTQNAFIRDLKTGDLRRIDAADPAEATGSAALSADNRRLTFVASAPAAGDHTNRVYVRDLRTGATELVSADTEGGPNDDEAHSPVIDAHGRRVAFSSSSADLVPADSYDHQHAYVRHLR